MYGRKPVLEALHDPGLSVAKVVLADNATGQSMQEILRGHLAPTLRSVRDLRSSGHGGGGDDDKPVGPPPG